MRKALDMEAVWWLCIDLLPTSVVDLRPRQEPIAAVSHALETGLPPTDAGGQTPTHGVLRYGLVE